MVPFLRCPKNLDERGYFKAESFFSTAESLNINSLKVRKYMWATYQEFSLGGGKNDNPQISAVPLASIKVCLISALFPFFLSLADSCLLCALSINSMQAMFTEMSRLIVSDNAVSMRNEEYKGVFFNLVQLLRTV